MTIKNKYRATCLTLFCLFFAANSFAQTNNETQEVPLILLKLNEIQDFPVNHFRNFIVTDTTIIDIQSLPGDTLRITAKKMGKTFLYIWDADGRKTLQFEVTGAAPNIVENFRPGYNPRGNEYIYRTTSSFQHANGQWLDPVWNHHFSSSVTLDSQRYWRTFLSGTTNAIGLNGAQSYTPFSSATVPNQLLTYYESPGATVALGDVNYDPGRLSLNGFPLRGGLFQLNHPNRNDQLQLFGGAARNLNRENYFFTQPKEYLYGVSGTKELWPNILTQGSFIFLDQPEGAHSFYNPNPQNDFVGDMSLIARPFNDLLTIETEYARSKDGHAYRGLLEYTPYWGRLLLSHRNTSDNYITPTSFFLLTDLTETSVIADIYATEASAFNLNYQRSVFGSSGIGPNNTTTNHRAAATHLYRFTKETSLLSGLQTSIGTSQGSDQYQQRAFVTYQKNKSETRDLLYAQAFVQHSYIDLASQNSRRMGIGYDIRATKHQSKELSLSLQHSFQVNRIQTDHAIIALDDTSHEFATLIGPTVMFSRNKHTTSIGFINNFIFRNIFENTSNLLQTFASYYYTANTALQMGVRGEYNVDPGLGYSYASLFGEFIYRFGSRVPDTLRSAFQSSATIEGVVFLDQNDDGRFQPDEPLLPFPSVQLNQNQAAASIHGDFRYKVSAGENQVLVHLPEQYRNHQFTTPNPQIIDVYPGERKTVYFGLNKRLNIQGSVVLQQEHTDRIDPMKNTVVRIQGPGTDKSVITSPTGMFHTYVTTPGIYTASLEPAQLPSGYKTLPPSQQVFTVEEERVNKVAPLRVLAQRRVFGFAFIDSNLNRQFDNGEKPLPNITVTIGNQSTTTDQDGSFVFEKISSGTKTISVSPTQVETWNVHLGEKTIQIPRAGRIDIPIAYQ